MKGKYNLSSEHGNNPFLEMKGKYNLSSEHFKVEISF